MTKPARNTSQVVYRRLTDEFDGDEMQALAYEFTGTKDVIFTDAFTLHERAIALTTWAVRHGRLAELLALIQEKRDK